MISAQLNPSSSFLFCRSLFDGGGALVGDHLVVDQETKGRCDSDSSTSSASAIVALSHAIFGIPESLFPCK